MSLDISLLAPESIRCDQCGHDQPLPASGRREIAALSITRNFAGMAVAAGLYDAMWHPELAVAPHEVADQVRCLERQRQWSDAQTMRGRLVTALRARHLVEMIRSGLALLSSDPRRFRAFEPPPGFGTYEGLLRSTEDYLAMLEANPDASVVVSR